MSEVKRWKLKGFLPGVEGECKAVFQPTVVMADDFDRVTADRDALQVLLTAAEEELDQCQSMALMIEEKEWAEHVGKGPISSQVESAFTQLHNELSEARQGLTAADERVDVLEGLLRRAKKYGGLTPAWHDAVEGALNPAEPATCCTVSAGNQALLDAGDYTPEELFGIGGKPSCSKCAP